MCDPTDKDSEEVHRVTMKKERVYSYKHCSHCNTKVSKSTYYLHQAMQGKTEAGASYGEENSSGSSSDDEAEMKEINSPSKSTQNLSDIQSDEVQGINYPLYHA